MTKLTRSGYFVKITCFVPADADDPDSMIAARDAIRTFLERLTSEADDIKTDQRYVHRRAVKAENQGETS